MEAPRMKIKIFSGLMVATLVLTAALLATPVYAQNPLPPGEPDQSWNPPEDSGETLMRPGVESRSSSMYYQPPQPGIQPDIQNAYFLDESGQSRTQFYDEPFYLVAHTNSAGYLYIAEYYPAESGHSPEWLAYRYYLDHAGAWTLGPFYPESFEPVGKHTWRLWFFSSGKWAQASAAFDYQQYYRPASTPTVSAPGEWGPLQVLIIAVLTGALGITIGMLIANRNRYSR
jgi:hypothetical protein